VKLTTAGRRRLSLARARHQLQSHLEELLGEGHVLGRTIGSLASPSHMAIETLQYESVDGVVSRLGTPEREVVCPTLQVSIQFRNQARQGLMTLRTVSLGPQLVPLPLQSFLRRHHIQVEISAPFQVAVVPERVSQKVQAGFLLFQVHHARLLTVDLRPHPGFQLLLDIPAQVGSQIARQHDKVSSAGESHPDALSEPYLNVSAHTAPAREPRRTPICQCANSLGSRREMRATQCVALRKCRRSFLYFR